LPGWIGSDGLKAAMFHAPCGCAIEDAARRDPDATARAVLELDAIACKEAWRCPASCGSGPPPDADHLPPSHRTALEAVARLTGFAGGTTCPGWYSGLPWVVEAVHAYEDWDKGALAAEHPHPSGALMDAVRLVRAGITARQADDFERSKRESEAKREADQ
jgi:hypothetical protein